MISALLSLILSHSLTFAANPVVSKCTIEVKNGICWAICRNDGFDVGFYEDKHKSCLCGRRRSFKELTGVSLTLPAQVLRKDDYYNW